MPVPTGWGANGSQPSEAQLGCHDHAMIAQALKRTGPSLAWSSCSLRKPSASFIVSPDVFDRLSLRRHDVAYRGEVDPVPDPSIAEDAADDLGFFSSHDQATRTQSEPNIVPKLSLHGHANSEIRAIRRIIVLDPDWSVWPRRLPRGKSRAAQVPGVLQPGRRPAFELGNNGASEHTRLGPSHERRFIGAEPIGLDLHVIIDPDHHVAGCDFDRPVARTRKTRLRLNLAHDRQPAPELIDDELALIGAIVENDHQLPSRSFERMDTAEGFESALEQALSISSANGDGNHLPLPVGLRTMTGVGRPAGT